MMNVRGNLIEIKILYLIKYKLAKRWKRDNSIIDMKINIIKKL